MINFSCSINVISPSCKTKEKKNHPKMLSCIEGQNSGLYYRQLLKQNRRFYTSVHYDNFRVFWELYCTGDKKKQNQKRIMQKWFYIQLMKEKSTKLLSVSNFKFQETDLYFGVLCICSTKMPKKVKYISILTCLQKNNK